MNPVPFDLESGWLLVAAGFFLAALGFLLAVRALGLFGHKSGTAEGIESDAVLLAGLLPVFLVAYLGRFTMLSLLAVIPIGIASFASALHAARYRRSRQRLVPLWHVVPIVVAGLGAGLVCVWVVDASALWDAGYFMPREVSGSGLFGAVGLAMIVLGAVLVGLDRGAGSGRGQIVVASVLVIVVVGLIAVDLWVLPDRPPFWGPQIVGEIRWVGRPPLWVGSGGESLQIELFFQPKRGTAKGVIVLLDPGSLDVVEADPGFHAVTEGRYVWRYTTLGREQVGRVEVRLRMPGTEDVEQQTYRICLFYAYTGEGPVLLDNQTIVTG